MNTVCRQFGFPLRMAAISASDISSGCFLVCYAAQDCDDGTGSSDHVDVANATRTSGQLGQFRRRQTNAYRRDILFEVRDRGRSRDRQGNG